MKKRLFIAVKLNETTINELRLFQKKLTRELPFKGIRWVDPGLFHLTLQFLGDTEESQLPTLISNLESAASKVKPFELSVEGAGFFGSNTSVRVLWAGTRPSSELRNLFNEVILATAFLRLEQDPRFSPHLTLARVADWLPKEESSRIAQIITENKAKVFGVTKITSFYLIESVLNPAGPVYKTMKIFDLV
jgi:2'-5' RNA ligase